MDFTPTPLIQLRILGMARYRDGEVRYFMGSHPVEVGSLVHFIMDDIPLQGTAVSKPILGAPGSKGKNP